MRQSTLLSIAIIGLLSFGHVNTASARDDVADLEFFTVNWENDRWANTDRHYTNGNRFAYLSSESQVPDWVKRNAAILPFFDESDKLRFSLAFGQNMFTPEDISSRQLQRNDRPYAGWLYLEGGLRAASEHHVDHLSISAGIVGESALGEPVQEAVHDFTNSPDPSGWDNQLKDEAAFMVSYEREWPSYFASEPDGWIQMDMTPRIGGSVGNVFTQLAVGSTLRIGFNLSEESGYPPRIRPSLTGTDYFEPADGLSGYLFGGIEGRRVFRNIFLDGNTFKNSHSVDREPFVFSAQAGIVLTYEGVRLSYTHVFMEEEFKQQTGDTQFGVISLSFSF